MKTLKRVLSLILVSVMVLAMSLPVFAADVTMGSNGNAFAGYKLLDIESYTTDANGKLQIIYKTNDTYRSILQTVTGKTTDDEILEVLQGYTTDSAELLAIAKQIHAAVGTAEFASVEENDQQVFKGLDKGYYLFVETAVKTPADALKGPFDDFASPMLVNVLDENITVKKKDGEVTDDKEVKETDDSTPYLSDWQKHGDYDIGDHVPYKLTGTVSQNFANYEAYFFKFYDVMDDGLTYDKNAKVYVDGTEITSGFVIDDTHTAADGRKGFTVTFADLKKVAGVQGGSVITVEFTATLNAKAIIGNPGNVNESYIEYSNNPDTEDKGTTPKKIVVVFTYKLIVNKVNEQNQPLEGAEFALYKLDQNAGAQIQDLVALGYSGKYVKVAVTKDTTGTKFTSERIDDGKYLLVETQTPDGYNSIAPIEFEIVATHAVDAATGLQQITSLELVPADPFSNIIYTPAAGTISADVVNTPGVLLPETGGMGTTIFYIVGALMVIGAGVVLVTRRRVQK